MEHERMPEYNERQMEELFKFDHLLSAISFYENETDTGLMYIQCIETSPGVTKEKNVFPIDQKLLGILDRTGFNMYQGFIAESEDMKLAADGILLLHHEAKDEQRKESKEKVITIWEASK